MNHRNRSLLYVALIVSCLVSSGSTATAADAPLRNSDLVQLTQAGLSDEIIIEKINGAVLTVFDVSEAGIAELLKGGVSEPVIKAAIAAREKLAKLAQDLKERAERRFDQRAFDDSCDQHRFYMDKAGCKNARKRGIYTEVPLTFFNVRLANDNEGKLTFLELGIYFSSTLNDEEISISFASMNSFCHAPEAEGLVIDTDEFRRVFFIPKFQHMRSADILKFTGVPEVNCDSYKKSE